VLFVEGTLLFAASAVRRHQHAVGRAAMPFTVLSSPDGSASGAAKEDSRGEVWTPVWTRDFSLAEIKQLSAEARASWRGRPARRAVDFYAATRTLGVARGIDEFTRYGLQRRNGLAFAAVPMTRVEVREQRQTLAKLAELLPYLGRSESVCEAWDCDSSSPSQWTALSCSASSATSATASSSPTKTARSLRSVAQ
jgi:CRISPR-associated protein Csx17